LNQFSKTLSVDLADSGIIAVSLCPGWVKTDMGGPNASSTVSDAVEKLLATMHKLRKEDSGAFLQHTGRKLLY
jgi:NAD(P)-dependent dehydrogenase (short-subunit alcohol dehydrogenase family)